MPALRRTLVAFGTLAVAFMAFSAVVAAGTMHSLDVDVSRAMTEAWREQLHVAFQGLALFGGLEMTTLVAAALGIWMWRRRFGVDSLAVLAFPVAVVLELLYKRIVDHPGPPLNISHTDGPSFSELVGQGVAAGSFPSGHVVRTVVTYGLLAFVIARLARRKWVGRLAVAGAVLLIGAECFDRLYLNVHWESDVIGGLLLGGVALAGAIIWLDRPWAST
ncbi:MAG TPA: phosphatase PAP2 family protein [Candidatus Dormibacteraeota bacterium]|jgi:undecaprenyl-diphosphatase